MGIQKKWRLFFEPLFVEIYKVENFKKPHFDEYQQFESILDDWLKNQSPFWSFEKITEVHDDQTVFPLWKIVCEKKDSRKLQSEKTTLILVGGVHGLERIGSQLCISMLEKYYQLSSWDHIFLEKLEHFRLVIIPFVNPAGIQSRTRSNPNGVDLMRNAPIEATEKVPFLAGGQNLTRKIPWYRGNPQQMEIESEFLVREIAIEANKSKFTVSLDIHSGFGMNDQIWFPWAFTKKPFPKLDFMTLMMEKFEQIFPYHIYTIEPQSKVYCTHGDLWDYILHEKVQNLNMIPLTLELGSWIWVKKNPFQIFKLDGLFNPIKKHRIRRTMRRHQLFIDFLMRFLIFTQSEQFRNLDLTDYYNKGLDKWYPHLKKIGSSSVD